MNVHPYPPQGGVFNPLIAIPALALGLGGIWLARRIYGHGHALTTDGSDPLAVNPSTGAIWNLSNARLYWDEFYCPHFREPLQPDGGLPGEPA